MPMKGDRLGRRFRWLGAAMAAMFALALPLAPALAELTISQLVVELGPETRTADIEVLNTSPERSFVSIEPREIVAPGTIDEKPFVSPDPELLGLLVSPRRMVLEPGQRRTVRIAAIGPAPARERVYRVTVKPVVGEVSGSETGLKLLVGYDLLVIARPASGKAEVAVSRTAGAIIFTNRGNSSVELVDGRQCDAGGDNCRELPNKRLYAGASWQQPADRPGKGEYRVRSDQGWSDLEF